MNEKVFIICIELNNKNAVSRFESTLSSFSMSHIKVTENTYAIRVQPSYNSDMIRDILLSKMGGDCILFVMRSSIDAAWRINGSADFWLKSYI